MPTKETPTQANAEDRLRALLKEHADSSLIKQFEEDRDLGTEPEDVNMFYTALGAADAGPC